MELRPYQADMVNRCVAFLRQPSDAHGIVVAPTGAGKSYVIAGLVRAMGQPCLVFQPSKEILEQNATKLIAAGVEPAVYSASVGSRDVGAVTLATIGSVTKNPGMFAGIRYVIVDECDLVNAKGGMYLDFLNALGDIRIIGLTATPFRLTTDGYGGSIMKFLTRTRPRVFTQVIAYAQIGTLVQQGHLMKPTYHAVPGFSRAALAYNTTGADFTDQSVTRHFNKIGFRDRLKRVVLRAQAVGRQSMLVFTWSIKQAEELAEDVPGVAVVTSKTAPKMRAAIVAGLREGSIQCVANVGTMTVGFDHPSLDTVVIARPTASLRLHYQTIGRVLRVSPTKADAWVVDMVGNVEEFGKVEDLWLRPSGRTGQQWEMVDRGRGDRPMTNVYFGDPEKLKRLREQRERQKDAAVMPW